MLARSNRKEGQTSFYVDVPPCGSDATGRPLSELVNTYVQNQGQGLSEYDTASEGIYVSKFQGLTLARVLYSKKISLWPEP